MSKKSTRVAAQSNLVPSFKGCMFSEGNIKIPNTHLIVNLTSGHHCPSDALGMCAVSNICYAKKCERLRPTYLAKNLAVEDWLATASDEDIYAMIVAYVLTAKHTITHIRLNEAGDFRNQEQVDQFSRIAKRLRDEHGIITYGWSARKDLDFTNVEFLLNGSSEEVHGAIRVFKAVPKDVFKALPKTAMTCGGSRGLNCRHCHVCHQNKFHGIVYCLNH